MRHYCYKHLGEMLGIVNMDKGLTLHRFLR